MEPTVLLKMVEPQSNSEDICASDGENYGEDEENDDQPTLFILSGVDTSLTDYTLEECLTNIFASTTCSLYYPTVVATILEKDYDEEGTILFCMNKTENHHNPKKYDEGDFVLNRIREYLSHSTTTTSSSTNTATLPTQQWIKDFSKASIDIVSTDESDDECVEYITEEEAYELWLTQNHNIDGDENYDSFVTSPDGKLIKPLHNNNNNKIANNGGDEPTNVPNLRLESLEAAQCNMTKRTMHQLERDPGLFEFDNVERVHYTELLHHLSDQDGNNNTDHCSSTLKHFGTKPIVFYGVTETTTTTTTTAARDIQTELEQFSQNLRDAIRRCGDETIVRTGNRETLINNGFHNSKPEMMGQVGVVVKTITSTTTTNDQDEEAAADRDDDNNKCRNDDDDDGTIIFNPIHELPPQFRTNDVLGRWVNINNNSSNDKMSDKNSHHPTTQIFPNSLWNSVLAADDDPDNNPMKKFTLCIANEGFGIGMHNHGPALFFLTSGTKKWYMSAPDSIDDLVSSNGKEATHPGFYGTLSSHKCIQSPGELLFVPNLWYHEIYNLASPTIGIQALSDGLAVSSSS